MMFFSFHMFLFLRFFFFFFQAEDGIRDAQESRGLGDVYKRQVLDRLVKASMCMARSEEEEKAHAFHYHNQVEAHLSKLADKINKRTVKEVKDKIEKFQESGLVLKNCEEAADRLDKLIQQPGHTAEELVAAARDGLAKMLDKARGHEITDQSIFRAHAAKYETEFMEDLESLGIKPPDVLTRVTEYVETVEAFIQQICDNGFGYESEGSVYFDTAAFMRSGHDYCKLVPQPSAEALAEGEGALVAEGKRKSDRDFALWKNSKPGEPYWESRWGRGRPGWHIECSAMAGDILGANMDIHTGGSDLKFPHHDNELAQSEACYGCSQWVNYFLHAGRLNIDGLKMSKSLKNFTTIRSTLNVFSARQLRIMFVSQKWNSTMMYDEETMEVARGRERKLRSYFGNIRAAIREQGYKGYQRWDDTDKVLAGVVAEVREKVHAALLDNLDCSKALLALLELVNECNKYMDSAKMPKALLLRKAAEYVTRILTIFGIVESPAPDGVGFAEDVPVPEAAALLDQLCAIRSQVRELARTKQEPSSFRQALEAVGHGAAGEGNSTMPLDQPGQAAVHFPRVIRGLTEEFCAEVSKSLSDEGDGAAHGAILGLCDNLRDKTLPQAGVSLEDRGDRASIWRLDDAATLVSEIAKAKAQKSNKDSGAQVEKEIKRLKQNIAKHKKDVEKLEAGKVAPTELYKIGEHAGNYSAWDAKGIPTADKEAAPINKGQLKKMQKNWSVQKKLFDDRQAKGGDAAVAELTHKISEAEAALEKLKTQ
eukprot:TRINITY_DN16136_c0_g1_i9.p1 TRINITY_DN16136_c0_g1~~TRINITY_DN16136_c0_g1_i9.p1  ORF type:complete len:766 (+),score=243.74 TRINITY_DN16136_c0_g1_i9:62-2359(+)